MIKIEGEIYTSTCPRCLKPGYYRVRYVKGKQYIYIYHGSGKYCHLGSPDELPNRYPEDYSALVKLTSKQK